MTIKLKVIFSDNREVEYSFEDLESLQEFIKETRLSIEIMEERAKNKEPILAYDE